SDEVMSLPTQEFTGNLEWLLILAEGRRSHACRRSGGNRQQSTRRDAVVFKSLMMWGRFAAHRRQAGLLRLRQKPCPNQTLIGTPLWNRKSTSGLSISSRSARRISSILALTSASSP